jgi:hypothetical protein
MAQSTNAISINLGTILLGLLSNGFGIAGTYEFAISNNFSINSGLSYLNMVDLETSDSLTMYTLTIGPRFYFSSNAVLGTYVGAYPTLLGLTDGVSTETYFGLLFELGYKWVLGGSKGLYFEPWLGYSLYFGDASIMNGFSYGIGIGIAF